MCDQGFECRRFHGNGILSMVRLAALVDLLYKSTRPAMILGGLVLVSTNLKYFLASFRKGYKKLILAND